MERIDTKTARQVWQRVNAPAPVPDRGDLHGLILAAAETAAIYRALIGMVPARQKERMRQLLEGQQETLQALLGLRRLAQVQGNTPKLPEPSGKSAAKLLEMAYHRAKRALTEYTARTIDPEFGPVFRVLAQREENHCAAIAALLGGSF